ncbi:MAG: DUF6783 domain-containing protein [Ruminococcus sp.]
MPNSVAVARYGASSDKISHKCDAHLAESLFKRSTFSHALKCQIAEDYGNTGSLGLFYSM